MRQGLINFFLKPARQSKAGLPSQVAKHVIYDEACFRYFLHAESKRSQRSGLLHHLLLAQCLDGQGAANEMDDRVGGILLKVFSQNLRETDYIGWYRNGHIIGGVLTVVGQNAGQLHECIQRRLGDILEERLGLEDSRRIRMRFCYHHELEGIEVGPERVPVNNSDLLGIHS